MATSTPSYLFYDIETTGLNKCFDQVVQFAAIRTDLDFKEIERAEIRVKLNKDVIPAPQAVITHRIGIQEMQQGLPEVEAIRKIHRLLNTPGTISLGYNTLGFDDEFLRFSFYRNLLPPYTHQFNNHCSRMDIYPITVMYYLYNRDALPSWPEREGKKSFKLADLNEANQLATGQAHDAMVDVEVTLALTKKPAQQQKVWDFIRGYFQKNTDLERLQQLPFSFKVAEQHFQEGLLISGALGHVDSYQAPVMSLGTHLHYRNQTLWLRLDDPQLSTVTENTIADTTRVFRKKLAEQPIILQPKPRFLNSLTEERKKITDENRLWLQKNDPLLKKISDYHRHYKYPTIENTDAEALLYDAGFPPPFEEKAYQQFHEAKPEKKEAIAKNFADPIRRELAMRLMARHYPNFLSEENHVFYKNFQQQVLSDEHPPINFRGEKHLTPQKALHEIEKLKSQNLDSQQQQLLIDLEQYLTHHLD